MSLSLGFTFSLLSLTYTVREVLHVLELPAEKKVKGITLNLNL